jgi:hypothetical protein
MLVRRRGSVTTRSAGAIDSDRTPRGDGPPWLAASGGRGRHRRRRRSRLVVAAIGLVVCVVLLGVLVSVLRSDPTEPGASQPVGGPSGVTWELQFDEQFDGDTETLVDSDVWHTGWFGDGDLTHGVNSRETALYTSENISVADGHLRLDVTPNPDGLELEDGTTQPNLGAALNTDEAQASEGFMMTYGYVEARMQLPAGTAVERVWPSFWLNGHTWPVDMEIDVVEGDGTDEGCKFNIHHGTREDPINLNGTDRAETVEGATNGMHTYAADIRPDGVTFYYDGVAVGGYDGEVPDSPRYLMVGLTTSGTMSSTKSLLVDHVRAWTRD